MGEETRGTHFQNKIGELREFQIVNVAADMAIANIDMKNYAGDVVSNGQINPNDLSAVSTDFGKTTLANPNSDVNGNGSVNATDLSAVLTNFGATSQTVAYTN